MMKTECIILAFLLIISVNLVSAETIDYSKYYLFVTNSTYTGAGNDPNGIDAICNKDVPFGIGVQSRPTNGTYKAYISRDGNYPGEALGMDSNRPIYRPDGVEIANNYLYLESGNWLNTIFSENYIGMFLVWIGITPSGEQQEKDCSDWTSNEGGGYVGLVGFGATSDKSTWAEFQSPSCDGSGFQKPRIYCIGPFEDEIVPYCGDGSCKGVEDAFNCASDCAPFLQKDRYYMFVTDASYDGNLGGIAGANAKCNSDIRKPTSGYKAFISTNENYPSAVSLGIDTSLPIYSTDTMKKIANNYADLIDGTIENPIYPRILWTQVWTANYPWSLVNGNYIIQESACDSWTSNDSSKTAYYGYPYAVPGYYPPVSESIWWKYVTNYNACSETHHLYCIGQYDGSNFCGDGIINFGLNEICDDGANNGKYGYCKSDCSGFVPAVCGDGVCNNGESCSSCSADCGACGNYYMFVSAWSGKGGDVQSIDNANNICNSDSNKPTGDKSGTYKAYLGNGQAWLENQNINPGFSIKRALDNVLIANNYADFKSGTIQNPISPINSNPARYWTGLHTVWGDSIYDCNGWSSSDNTTILGWSGCGEYTSNNAAYISCGTSHCSDIKNLLCIGPLNYCGDLVCNNGESCSTCSNDCGACPVVIVNPPAGGGGGGGGGGGTPSGGSTSNAGKVAPTTLNLLNQQTSSDSGYTAELRRGDSIRFQIQNGTKLDSHTLRVDEIGGNYVNVTVQSSFIKLALIKGEEVKINLTSPDYYDLSLKLESISNSKASITIKTINEQIQQAQSGPISLGITGSVIGFAQTKNGIILIIGLAIIILILIIWLLSLVNKKQKRHK